MGRTRNISVKLFAEGESLEIERSNILLNGASEEPNEKITAVELVAHTYREDESAETKTLYSASETSSNDESIIVKFPKPCYDIQIKNGTLGKYSATYAKITNVEAGCVLTGKEYESVDTVFTKSNPHVLLSDLENVITIDAATLVNPDIAVDVLERCYAYYDMTTNLNFKTVDNTVTELFPGKIVKVASFFDEKTTYKGVITEQSYFLSAGKIIKTLKVLSEKSQEAENEQ